VPFANSSVPFASSSMPFILIYASSGAVIFYSLILAFFHPILTVRFVLLLFLKMKNVRLLIVSATALEIKPLLTELGEGKELKCDIIQYQFKHFQVDVLITGVGIVPTAARTAMALGVYKYDAVINAGICGSFNHKIALGKVLNIITDCLPEAGVEDGEHFLSIIDLKLLDQDEFPFSAGKLVNDSVFDSVLIDGLDKVTAVTVNTAHGNAASIKAFLAMHHADVESMEGAAFIYSCKIHNVKHIQIRSVSNYIEDRDVSKWNIPLAVQNLNHFLLNLLNE
jgi:futalosine hydrolase